MSLERNQRRLAIKAEKKGTEPSMVNLHVAHKKSRRYGTGIVYNSKAGHAAVMGGSRDD